METLTDVAINPDPVLAQADYVGASFFIASMMLLVSAIFLFFQVNRVPARYRNPVLIGTRVVAVAAFNSLFRRSYWVETQTNPTEFRFFDWFLTVPLMSIEFYLLLRDIGGKIGMLVRLLIASFWMLIWGYIGEALYPEQSIWLGSVASLGLVAIVSIIMAEGYPKIFRNTQDKALRRGYVALSIMLPLGWMVYPICFMAIPGNLLEGSLSVSSISLLYNIADVFNKAGLGLGVYLIAKHSQEAGPELPHEKERIEWKVGSVSSSIKPDAPRTAPASSSTQVLN